MKVLVLPRYGRLGASSRLRSFQYVTFLRNSGFEIRISPLLGDDYVRDLYQGHLSYHKIALRLAKRVVTVLSSRKFDVLMVEKELLPWIPAWIELGIVPKSVRLVVDYDDAVFHRYDLSESIFVRAVLGRKIDEVMKRADLVLVGSNYLRDRALCAGARRVQLIPTVVDLSRYKVRAEPQVTGRVVIGWIGTPATAKYLQIIGPVLKGLAKESEICIRAIGILEHHKGDLPIDVLPWSEETEVDRLMSFDIGIMPLPDEPFERGKCGYKIVQYMACGIPAVASPVGVNTSLIDEGVNGYLPSTLDEWSASLRSLASSAQLRVQFGKAGRSKVEANYCLSVAAPVLARALRSL